jgi:fructose-1,6-bisphosphatase/inositol monophosphatase family enzyme
MDVRGLISGYDIAGAALILKEAGGIVTDMGGEELRSEVGQMHNVDLVAALEPEMHRKMLAVLTSK